MAITERSGERTADCRTAVSHVTPISSGSWWWPTAVRMRLFPVIARAAPATLIAWGCACVSRRRRPAWKPKCVKINADSGGAASAASASRGHAANGRRIGRLIVSDGLTAARRHVLRAGCPVVAPEWDDMAMTLSKESFIVRRRVVTEN